MRPLMASVALMAARSSGQAVLMAGTGVWVRGPAGPGVADLMMTAQISEIGDEPAGAKCSP